MSTGTYFSQWAVFRPVPLAVVSITIDPTYSITSTLSFFLFLLDIEVLSFSLNELKCKFCIFEILTK